jgi:hypothetical protein
MTDPATPALEPMPGPFETLEDPYRPDLLTAGKRTALRMRRYAPALQGEPAFDPRRVKRLADALALPEGARFEHPLMEKAVRIGLAHIDLTFQGDQPKYGADAYAAEEHDGFPPTIIAAVDALTAWGFIERAQQLLEAWTRRFVRQDGTIDYYAPSLSEYGQLLTTLRRVAERGGARAWVRLHCTPFLRIARMLADVVGPAPMPELPSGVPEADMAHLPARYFHNAAWISRGLRDWAWLAEKKLGLAGDAVDSARTALRLRLTLNGAVRETWGATRTPWWLAPFAEEPAGLGMEAPKERVTDTELGSYTNYRYWPELLASDALTEDLSHRIVAARLAGGGQWLGMTRFLDRADDWPMADLLDGMWRLKLRSEVRYCLWGHILYHQAEGHMTAYEQVTLPAGAPAAPYCLPAQLVAVRAARRLT